MKVVGPHGIIYIYIQTSTSLMMARLYAARRYSASVLTTRSAVSMACRHRTLEGIGIFRAQDGASVGQVVKKYDDLY